MEANEDVSVVLEITIYDSLLQLLLKCEPIDDEDTKEEEEVGANVGFQSNREPLLFL